MQALHVFQILNHYTSRQELDQGFGVLDNSANERPDWFEYWPIRRYLKSEALDENAFYGFLSPKFRLKTNLTSAGVREFVAAAGPADETPLGACLVRGPGSAVDAEAKQWSVRNTVDFE